MITGHSAYKPCIEEPLVELHSAPRLARFEDLVVRDGVEIITNQIEIIFRGHPVDRIKSFDIDGL